MQVIDFGLKPISCQAKSIGLMLTIVLYITRHSLPRIYRQNNVTDDRNFSHTVYTSFLDLKCLMSDFTQYVLSKIAL